MSWCAPSTVPGLSAQSLRNLLPISAHCCVVGVSGLPSAVVPACRGRRMRSIMR